jgi:UTP:GlnB (protein PII) uridylyltransferase
VARVEYQLTDTKHSRKAPDTRGVPSFVAMLRKESEEVVAPADVDGDPAFGGEAAPKADAGFVDAFAASMPEAYRAAFDADAIAAHAGVVQRRGGSATRVEIWRKLPERVLAICVVADDHPGLLAQISAALLAHDIDVVSANAHLRRRDDGAAEAVDILWIRRVPRDTGSVAPIRERDIEAINELTEALVRGRAKLEQAAPYVRPTRSIHGSARVRFEKEKDGTIALTVEAVDRPGLLLVVTKTIFRAGLQIVGLRATSEGGRAIDRFQVAEPDGGPLGQGRQLALQTAIFAAIEERRGED